MLVDQLERMLQEASSYFNINLSLEGKAACQVDMPNGLTLVIEPAADGDGVMVFCGLANVPPGRYREDLFAAGLKANGLAERGPGVFGFLEKSALFGLYERIPENRVTGKRIFSVGQALMEKGTTWKDDIDGGRIPIVQTGISAGPSSGMFGMMP